MINHEGIVMFSMCTGMQERYEFEIDDLKKRLRSERSIRKGCEKWLRAELKSRVRITC